MLVVAKRSLLLYSIYAKRGDPHSNGLCMFIQSRNVAASTWLRLSLDSRLSTYCAEVAQATQPNVAIASITLDAPGIEGTYLTVICHAHE